MLYETDAVAEVRRPGVRDYDDDDEDGGDGIKDCGKRLCSGLRRSRPPVPATVTATTATATDPLQQTVVVVRPAAAYVEHTFAAGLTAFREYNYRVRVQLNDRARPCDF